MVGAGAGKGGEEGHPSHKRVGRGTDTCVYVLLQGGNEDCSALHYASKNGLESAVAKLLSLGADAALKDKVRACSYMKTCMYSVDVCMFVNVLLIRISLSLMHHMCVRMPLKDTYTHSCMRTHTCSTGGPP